MTLLLIAFRLGFLLVMAVFAGTALAHLIHFYEAANADGAKGIRHPLTRTRIGKGLSAWARESAVNLLMIPLHMRGWLPRGRLRQGSWLPGEREVRYGAPVLIVPGYGMSRGTLSLLRQRLEEARRPALAIDLPLWKPFPALVEALGNAVSELKRATGAEKVDLVCHSRGGLIAAWWIQHGGGAAHVERIVCLGAPIAGTKMAAFAIGPSAVALFPGSVVCRDVAGKPLDPSVRWFAVNGGSDGLMVPQKTDDLPPPGFNIRVPGVGHNGLLVSATVWKAIHIFLQRPAEVIDGVDIGFENESVDEAALRAIEQATG